MVSIPNYFERSVALLASQFQITLPNGALTNFQKMLYAICTQFQLLNTQQQLLLTNRTLSGSQGVQLDGIGQIVGLARKSGQPDDSGLVDGVYQQGYREDLQFQMFLNSSDGTPEEMIYILKYLTSASRVWYNEVYPAAYFMTTNGINFLEYPSNPSDLVGAIQAASPAGVNFMAIIATYGTNPFVFSGDPFETQFAVAPNPDDITQINPLQVNPGSGAENLFVQIGERHDPFFGGGFAEAIGTYPDYTYDNIGAGQMTRSYNATISRCFMSLPEPTVMPTWATNDQVDPVSGQNNVLTPPPEMQTYGWTRSQFPPRQWFNWLGRYTAQWIAYLAQRSGFTVSSNGTSSPVVHVVDPTIGGMVFLNAVDTSNPTYYAQGICYFPPNSVSPVTVNLNGNTTLVFSTISVAGVVTVSGGSGSYILSATQTPPP